MPHSKPQHLSQETGVEPLTLFQASTMDRVRAEAACSATQLQALQGRQWRRATQTHACLREVSLPEHTAITRHTNYNFGPIRY